MRIGVSTSVIQRGKTGIAQYLFSLLDAFFRLDPPHEFVLFVLEDDLTLFQPWKSRFELVSVPEHFRDPVRNILWHQTALPRPVRRFGLDLLHVPSYRRLLWPKPCPTVATIHDLAPFRVPAKYDPLRMLYGRVIVKALAHRQDQIIAVSRNTAQDVQLFFKIPAERITVVHNGIDHRRFNPSNANPALNALTSKFQLEEPFFLYVARLEHPGKNHVRLVAAFDQFKRLTQANWHLVLAGSDWHGADVIHTAIRQSDSRQVIHALGFVPNETLPDLYRAASALIYPSLYEGFGLPPVEAMACGCPVISSNRGALNEIVHGAALVIDPENTNEICAAMTQLATDLSLRKKLVKAGLARAQCFTWEKAAQQTLEIYSKAAGRALSR